MPYQENMSKKGMVEALSELHELLFSSGSSLNLQAETDAFLSGLFDKFSCSRVSLHLLTDGELVIASSFGPGGKEEKQEGEPALRSPLLDEILSSGSPINLCDRTLSAFASQLLLPMRRHTEFAGVLWLARIEPLPFSDRDGALVEFLLERFSLSLDRTLMYQELERKNQELNALNGMVIKAKADWQNTFDSIQDMICILDTDLKITRVNRAFSARLKKSYDELIGATCHEIIHGTSDPPEACPFSTILETGRPSTHEMEIQIGDSLFAASLFPYRDSSGAMQGAVHIFRDISDQKALQDKLVQTETMAAVGTLAAEIAHEINNPLDYINNYLYLLSESLPAEFDKHEYLDKIEAGIDNLATLTRDLLEFARPQIDTFVPLELHAVIDASLEFSAKYLQEKHIRVQKEYHGTTGMVMGSERMLQQVFLNLILNALDAMPDGGTLTISTRDSEDTCILTFTDTGTGIPEANLPKLFEPFFTTKKTTGKRGSGLGLTICYNIINHHDGEISVASTTGEGSTFTLVLPGPAGRVKKDGH